LHSYLGVLPLLSLVLVVVLSWQQFLVLFGLGTEPARFAFVLKEPGLPLAYVLSVIGAAALLEVLPYLEELVRGLLQPRKPRSAPNETCRDLYQHVIQTSARQRIAWPTRTRCVRYL